jgi:hypothetical protein
MKNKIFALIIFSISNLSLLAQVPNWVWAKSAGGSTGDNRSYSSTTDSYGNVYITGCFNRPSITFGTTTLLNTDTSGWTFDIFIVKYDASGNLLWAKGEGGINSDIGNCISVDVAGNVYVTGSYSYPSISFGSFTFTNIGTSNIFIVKYDSSGNVIWAQSAGGAISGLYSNNIGRSICTDSIGNVYLTGIFTGTISFGAISLTNIYPSNLTDIFIVKFDSLGNVLWARREGGNSSEDAHSIIADSYGNVYLTGFFNSPTFTLGTTILINNGTNYSSDMFVAKYDSSGNAIWAFSAGGIGQDIGKSITADASGNIYVAGFYTSESIIFGTDTLINLVDTIDIYNQYDMFIIKITPMGIINWVKGSENISNYAINVIVDSSDNVYLSGSFIYSMTFGVTTITSSGSADLFIVKYDSSGNEVWVMREGGAGYDASESIAIDASGNIFVTGWFTAPSITFGATTLTNTSFVNSAKDVFIAKLGAILVGHPENITNKFTYINPNPFNLLTTFKFNTEINNGKLKVYDSNGHVVKEIKGISGSDFAFYRDNFACGLYFIELIVDNKIILTDKFVIVD